MSRETWIWDAIRGELVPAEEYARRKRRRTPRRRSDLACPNPIGDFSEPLMNPADGQRYHSKRAYDRAVARAGCVAVHGEMHNLAKLRPQLTRRRPGHDIKRAIEQLKSGRARTVYGS